jgi:pimeloyl-ACP methyl ester carboxylesterase
LGTFHYVLRLRSFDGTPLAATYFPSKLSSAAPVVMLIHEMDRSRKDFQDAVLDLKGQGLAEHLQGLGYAVLTLDLRGQGQNPRGRRHDTQQLLEDLQAGYFFLVDRHNRGDLNLAKLGVIALGDGANLVSAWAFQPSAAVTTEGKPSDLNALVLVSPKPEGSSYVLGHVLASLAPRIPLLLLAGERDVPSKDAVQSVRQVVQRARLSKVEMFPSSLHGYKLLRLEPKITAAVLNFLDTALKNRPVEWEPQYNLTPVTFGDAQMVLNAVPMAGRKDAAKAKDQAKNASAPAQAKKSDEAKNKKGAEAARNQPIPKPKENTPPPPQPEKPG